MKLLFGLWVLYGIYLVYSVAGYFRGKSVAVNQDIYQWFYVKKIGMAAGLLLVSIILYMLKKPVAAKWVAGIPAAVFLLIVMIGVAAWIFTWFVMWIGSK